MVEGRDWVPIVKKGPNLHRVFLGGADRGSTVKQYRDLLHSTTVEKIKTLKGQPIRG